MKKLFTMLFAFVLISALAYSQTAIGSKANEVQPNTDFKAPVITKQLNELGKIGKATDKQLVDAFIDTVRDATFSFYGYITPVAYEPISKTLIQAQNYRFMPNQTDLYGSVYIKYSTNGGLTWLSKQFWNEIGKIPVWASVAVLNPSNKTNPLDLDYVFSGPVAIQEGTQYPWKGDFWLLVNGQNSSDPLVVESPGQGYRWFWTRAAANKVGGQEIFYNVGTLTNQPGFQYGAYGNSAFNMSVGDFVTQNIPPQWDLSKFRPSTNPNSSYNDYLYIDVDNQGAAYVGVKNMFADDIDNRVPAVSKTVDGGANWSEFDRMPASLITNYINVYGGDQTRSGIIPYSSDGFVVSATDNFSFLFRLFVGTTANEYQFHIVEAFKKGGAWGIRKVGDFSGYNLLAVRDVGEAGSYKDTIMSSSLGNELQLTKTADGRYVIAKWVDYNGDTLMVTPRVILNEVDTLNVINTTDVFMAYRDVNSTDWSAPVNVTNTKDIDKCSYLPLTVPDLQNVYLFTMATFRSQYTDPNNPRNQYPMAAWQLLIDTWQGVGFTKINLGETDVKEENYNFSVNDIYPNPANEAAELTFNLNAQSNVNIQIFDLLGHNVANVMNNVLGQGLHGVNIDVNGLNNGTYYVRLTVGGQSITKSLNVIR